MFTTFAQFSKGAKKLWLERPTRFENRCLFVFKSEVFKVCLPDLQFSDSIKGGFFFFNLSYLNEILVAQILKKIKCTDKRHNQDFIIRNVLSARHFENHWFMWFSPFFKCLSMFKVPLYEETTSDLFRPSCFTDGFLRATLLALWLRSPSGTSCSIISDQCWRLVSGQRKSSSHVAELTADSRETKKNWTGETGSSASEAPNTSVHLLPQTSSQSLQGFSNELSFFGGYPPFISNTWTQFDQILVSCLFVLIWRSHLLYIWTISFFTGREGETGDYEMSSLHWVKRFRWFVQKHLCFRVLFFLKGNLLGVKWPA